MTAALDLRSPVSLWQRFHADLWLLFAGNLAVWSAALMLRRAIGHSWGRSLAPALNGCATAQLLILVLAAALIPRRTVLGLAVVIGFAFLYGYVARASGGMAMRFVGLDECLRALPMLAAVQALRLFLGWRLTRDPLPHRGSSQYHLAELMEWTTSIAAAFGIFVLFQQKVRALDYEDTATFLLYFSQHLLLGVPVALAIVSRALPNRKTILALFFWCILITAIHFLAELFLYRNRLPLAMLLIMVSRGTAPSLAAFFPVLIVNALIIRRLGYRWHTRTRR